MTKYERMDFFPESFSLLKDIISGNYKFLDFMTDIKAGILLSILCFPLVLAYASASGLNPEIGLTTAIATGVITFFLGGGKFHVICPTGAFIVIINDIVTRYNYDFLIHATVLAGVILLIGAYFKLGCFAKYIPLSVLRGFLTGIGISLVIQQWGNILGINCSGNLFNKLYQYCVNYNDINVISLMMGVFFIFSFYSIRKFFPKLPVYFIVLAMGLCFAYFFPDTLETVNSRFHLHSCEIKYSSVVLNYNWNTFVKILPYSIVIAFLAGIETLLGAVMVEDVAKIKHHTNAELINVGVTNFVTFILNMMPSTCAISMTSVNTKNAKSNISILVNVVCIYLLMTILSKYIANVSMCCFASMVIPFGIGMIDYKSFRAFKGKNKVAFVLTTVITLTFNVVYAVIVGLIYNYLADIKSHKVNIKARQNESIA